MKVEMQLGSEKLSIETGKVAKQADGAVWVQYGGTVVLVTVVADDAQQDLDFFPFNRRIIYDIISGDNILDGSHNSPFQSSPDKVRVGQETTLSGNIPIGL